MKKINFPSALVLVIILMAVFVILTHIIPPGEYQTVEKNGRTLLKPDSFEFLKDENSAGTGQGIGEMLIAPVKGLIASSQIILFCLLLVGHFLLLTEAVQ